MDKFAQGMGLNKLREMTNISGIAAEKFFNPEFQRVMKDLRLKDDNMRSIVAGETIGDGNTGKDRIALKALLKQARSNLNRREYMSAVADLGRFQNKLSEIIDQIKELDTSVDQVHNEFLFKDLDEEKKKHLHNLKSRLANQQTNLTKEAGILDFLHNIGSQRGRALAAWEKRYPKQTKKLKADTEALLKLSEGLLSFILSTLKDMAKARALRNVDAYMASASKIDGKFTSYNTGFKVFYAENIKGFLEKMNFEVPNKENLQIKTDIGPDIQTNVTAPPPGIPDLVVPTQQSPVAAPFTGPPGPATLTGPPTGPSTLTGPPAPMGPSALTGPPSPNPTLPSPSPVPTESGVNTVPPEGLKSDELAKQFGWPQVHAQFYTTLQSLAGESPLVMKSFITKYAKRIEASDPSTAIQLLNIVKSIKG